MSVSLFCHRSCLIDQKGGWLTKEPLRYERVCFRLVGVNTNFTALMWCLFYHDFLRLPPVCLFVSMIAPSPFPAKHQLNKQNRHDPLLCPDLYSVLLTQSVPAGIASLPSYAERYSGCDKSFRIRSRAQHLTWWLTHTLGHHSWQMLVVYFGAGIRGCV